jgi:hypothetical protein
MFNELQPLKFEDMLLIPSPIVKLLKPVQPSKARSPILVTLSGIVMLVNPVQSLKALLPILVTVSGITTVTTFVNLKALVSILVTGNPFIELGITMGISGSVPLHPVMKTSVVLAVNMKSPNTSAFTGNMTYVDRIKKN